MKTAFWCSLLLLTALRVVSLLRVEFGDSEALYVSYAMHPQPMYLDHPAGISLVGEALGTRSPIWIHATSTLLSLISSLLVVACVRARRFPMHLAYSAGLLFNAIPMFAVGLFAWTPDVFLCPIWLGSLFFLFRALGRTGPRRDLLLFAAAFLAGFSGVFKVSGVLLAIALAIVFIRSRSLKTNVWAWSGLAIGILPTAFAFASHGQPMFAHRFSGIGASWRGVGVATLGQFLYASPIVVYLFALNLKREWRKTNPLAHLIFVPLFALSALTVVHTRSEPHWLGPVYLTVLVMLPKPILRSMQARSSLRRGAVLAGFMSLAVYAWVLSPWQPRLARPELDIRNELIGWREVGTEVQKVLSRSPDAAIVGPHWIVCAQLHATLGTSASFGCAGDAADFATWYPNWRLNEEIIYVTDRRFPEIVVNSGNYAVESDRTIPVTRNGMIVREFRILHMRRRALARINGLPTNDLFEPSANFSENKFYARAHK